MMIGVTGASGRLGVLVLAELLQRTDAQSIVGMVRSPEKAAGWAQKGITLRKGDYNDYDSLVQAMAGVDTLLFISNANVGNREAEHKNVVNAAKAAGVAQVVYTSITGVEADNMLAAGHLFTERYI
ncbi:MAG: NAD(P)H-binding protein, partial [Anaerolineae bacterium]|nr:NAD(P)H-binding protein [Anaerolineae bacterium]